MDFAQMVMQQQMPPGGVPPTNPNAPTLQTPFAFMQQQQPPEMQALYTPPATEQDYVESQSAWQRISEKLRSDPNAQRALLHAAQYIGQGGSLVGAANYGFTAYDALSQDSEDRKILRDRNAMQMRKDEAGLEQTQASTENTRAGTQATKLETQFNLKAMPQRLDILSKQLENQLSEGQIKQIEKASALFAQSIAAAKHQALVSLPPDKLQAYLTSDVAQAELQLELLREQINAAKVRASAYRNVGGVGGVGGVDKVGDRERQALDEEAAALLNQFGGRTYQDFVNNMRAASGESYGQPGSEELYKRANDPRVLMRIQQKFADAGTDVLDPNNAPGAKVPQPQPKKGISLDEARRKAGLTTAAPTAVPQAKPTQQRPATGVNMNDFEAMLTDAKRNGSVGKAYFEKLIKSGEPLSPQQRMRMREAGIKY